MAGVRFQDALQLLAGFPIAALALVHHGLEQPLVKELLA
jgi:hypothetical protein